MDLGLLAGAAPLGLGVLIALGILSHDDLSFRMRLIRPAAKLLANARRRLIAPSLRKQIVLFHRLEQHEEPERDVAYRPHDQGPPQQRAIRTLAQGLAAAEASRAFGPTRVVASFVLPTPVACGRADR